MKLKRSRWKLKPPVPEGYWAYDSGLTSLVAQLLYNRGITTPEQADVFFAADSRLVDDPGLLSDINKALPRLRQAVMSSEKIVVYGDFDSDGITATAIMVSGLSALGARVTPYIPHRLTEGHGLNTTALERLHKEGTDLVITVDCGVTAVAEVRRASRAGLDIIITDHHTPLDELPPAVAVIDPQRKDSKYPFKELAGAGVAYKLLQALYRSLGRDENELEKLLDLVALGTVADLMPLSGENRYFVKKGLEVLNERPRLGIRQIIEQSRLKEGCLTAESISWMLAPRLNAVGRLEHAMAGYDLLMTDSDDRAAELVSWLEEKNAERQKMTASFQAAAREQVLAGEVPPFIVFQDRECHAGIVGLVAGRLTDEFYRPSMAVRLGDHSCTGSCRSIPEFNIIEAISQCSDLTSHFGGHAQAAGFSLPTENLPVFEERLSQIAAEKLSGLDLRPTLEIDAEVSLDDLSNGIYESIQRLAPFGRGNPSPTFLSRNLTAVDYHSVGNNGQHLRLKVGQGDSLWDCIAFNMGEELRPVLPAGVDLVYNLEMDYWHGMATLRLNVVDFAPPGKFQTGEN